MGCGRLPIERPPGPTPLRKNLRPVNYCNYNQLRLALRAPCDGHHEMSDLGADGEPVHSGGESVNGKCGRTPAMTLARDGERS